MPTAQIPYPKQINLSTLTAKTGFTITGIKANSYTGYSVSGIGDFNGDGIPDFLVMNEVGECYVIYGTDDLSQIESFDLNSLNGTNGFKIIDLSSGSFTGAVAVGISNVNGNGYGAILIGSLLVNNNQGEGYVIFGGPNVGSTGTFSLSSLNGLNGFRIPGLSSSIWCGASVASVDLNRDGKGDIIIACAPSNSFPSTVYVIYGALNLGSSGVFSLSSLNGTNGFKLVGSNTLDADSGISVSGLGDVNADNYKDFIVGLYNPNNRAGVSHVILGGPNIGGSGTLLFSNLNGTNGFSIQGITPGDLSGISVGDAGDVNNDNISDIVIGATNVTNGTGAVYVVLGAPGIGQSGTFLLVNLNGTNGFTILGLHFGDRLGCAVRTIGDFNRDGFSDLFVGACGFNNSAGAGNVILGAQDIGASGNVSLLKLNGRNGFTLLGGAPGDYAGSSVSAIGDIDRDGFPDFIVGAYGANNFLGAAYILFGNRLLTLSQSPSLSLALSRTLSASSVSMLMSPSNSYRSSRSSSRELSLSNSSRSSKSLSKELSLSNSSRDSKSPSRELSLSNSDSFSDAFSSSNSESSAINSISQSKILSRSSSRQISMSRLVDWVLSRSRTVSSSLGSFTSSDENSISPSLTPLSISIDEITRTQITLGFPHIPPNTPLIPPDVVVVVTNIATGAGVVSSLLSHGVNSATSASRLIAYCADDTKNFNRLLYAPFVPVALDYDAPEAAAINGAIIFTMLLIASAFAAYLCTGYFRNQSKPSGALTLNWTHEKLAKVFVWVMSFYVPNMTEIAVFSIGHFYKGDRGLAIAAMAILYAALFRIGFLVYRSASKGESKYSLLPLEEPVHFGNKASQLAVVADIGVGCFLALLAGIQPNTQWCVTIAASMLIVSTSYFLYIVRFRPYRSKVEEGLVAVNALVQSTLSVLNIWTIYSDNEILLTFLEVVQLIALCYPFVQVLTSLFIDNIDFIKSTALVVKLMTMYKEYKEARVQANTENNLSALLLPNNHSTSSFDMDEIILGSGRVSPVVAPAEVGVIRNSTPDANGDEDTEMSPQPLKEEEDDSVAPVEREDEEHGLSRSPVDRDFSQPLLGDEARVDHTVVEVTMSLLAEEDASLLTLVGAQNKPEDDTSTLAYFFSKMPKMSFFSVKKETRGNNLAAIPSV